MGIKRTSSGLESNFTTVPNSWVRDSSLSFRARGLLAMLMSHSAGWSVTISSLASQNIEGKDAILTAVRELEARGYLKRESGRAEGGRFDADWILQDPPPAVEDYPPTVADYPRRFSRDGSAATANPPLKKNSNKKTKGKENQTKSVAPQAVPAKTDRGHRVPEDFMPAQKHIDKIRAMKPGLNLDIEHTKFMNYWLAATGTRATKKDWGRTWENWMLNAKEEQGYKPGWQKRLEYNAQVNQQYQEDLGAEFLRSIER